jgi:outer membrane protein assembly factor BamD
MAFDSSRAALTGRRARSFISGAWPAAAAVLMVAAACASGPQRPPTGTPDPDRFLFERGTDRLNKKDWFTSREYFRQLVDSYPQSQYRGDAKLGIGDTYIGEGTAESYVLGINEYKEFLSFYPTHVRADYAQFKLGMAHYYQMRSPMRDQSETIEAIRELTIFLERFQPRANDANRNALIKEGQQRLREARDRLGEHELGVGIQYHRSRWYPGAIERLKGLLEKDPQFTRRDAALFYLADCFEKVGKPAEALPYFDRILKEFEQSEFLDRAKLRAEAIRASLDKKVGGL